MEWKNRIIGEGTERPENLLANPLNFRTHPQFQQDALKGVLSEVGWVQRVIVNKRTGFVVDGHARVTIAMRDNIGEVPVLYVDLSEEEERLVLASLDPIGALAGQDDEQLRALLDSVSTDDPALQALFDQLAESLVEPEEIPAQGLTDEDAVPEVQPDPVTRPGDVWVMGKHRLMCGDSTRIDEIERLCGGNQVDMWLTDPPYNVDMTAKNEMLEKAGKARKDKASFGIKNDAMSDEDFRQFLTDCYVAADAVMKPGAVFYIWHADSEGYNFRGAARDAGWKVRQCLIWAKSVFAIGRNDYHWKHEPCLYGWKDGAGHLWASDRKQTTLINFDKPAKSGEHPTMKPVGLFEYLMLNNTKGGDIVLDSFGDSGTTLIAAEKNGRVSRLMELDPKYCDVIVKRWQEFTGKAAVLEGDGRTFGEIWEESGQGQPA